MNYGELKSHFRDLLNRSDCTDEQVVIFLKQATTRIQRTLRVPAMERVMSVVAEAPLTGLQIPTDYIELQDILVNGYGLEKVSTRTLMAMSNNSGCPRYYTRIADRFVMRPTAPTGTEVVVLYYGEFEGLTDDTSSNGLTAAAPDLLIYGALAYAGDFFEHDKRSEWEGRYQEILTALQQQAIDDEFMGGPMSVQSAYPEY
jgi:hypothetical protein